MHMESVQIWHDGRHHACITSGRPMALMDRSSPYNPTLLIYANRCAYRDRPYLMLPSGSA